MLTVFNPLLKKGLQLLDEAGVGEGVTGGDAHDHSGGDGAQINHVNLSNIGANTHAQIDSHIANGSNPHSVTKTQVSLGSVTNDAQLKIASNLSDLNNVGTARTNLGLVAGGPGDIWVEKAGDTMSGPLVITGSDGTETVINEGAFAHIFRVETQNQPFAFQVLAEDEEILSLVPFSNRFDNSTNTLQHSVVNTTNNVEADAGIRFAINASGSNRDWVMGLDNTDDKFKLSYNTQIIGTNPVLIIDGSGTITVTDLQINETAYFDAEVDNGNSSTADTIDWSTGNCHKSTVTGNVTYTFTAPPGPCHLTFTMVHEASGTSYARTWPATVKWAGGVQPTWTQTSGAVDVVSFYYNGTSYFGMAGLAFA